MSWKWEYRLLPAQQDIRKRRMTGLCGNRLCREITSHIHVDSKEKDHFRTRHRVKKWSFP